MHTIRPAFLVETLPSHELTYVSDHELSCLEVNKIFRCRAIEVNFQTSPRRRYDTLTDIFQCLDHEFWKSALNVEHFL